MAWNAPDNDLAAIHPDWLGPVAHSFGDGVAWREMRADPELRPYLLDHIIRFFFGEAPEVPSRPEDAAKVDRAIGRDGLSLVRRAGWLWFAPVLLPPLITGGVVPGLTPPKRRLMQALTSWCERNAEGMVLPTSDRELDAVGGECRLIWINQMPKAVAIRAMLQVTSPGSEIESVTDEELGLRIFEAALDLGPDE